MVDQKHKTLRSFYCEDALWEMFEVMTRDLDCSMDYLINEAMRHHARSKNYSLTGMNRLAPSVPSYSQSAPQQSYGSQPQQVAPPPPPAHPVAAAPPPPPPPPPPPVQAPPPPPPPAHHMEQKTIPLPAVVQNVPPPAQQQDWQTQQPPPSPQQPFERQPTSRLPPPPPRVAAPAAPIPPAPSPPVPPYAPHTLPPHGAAYGSGQYAQPHPPAPGPPPRPQLFLYFNGQRYTIDQERFVIGRGSQQTDLTIRDGNISRKHAAVIFHGGQYFVQDLGSTNGVEFRGTKVTSKQIEEGDLYNICDYELRFSYVG